MEEGELYLSPEELQQALEASEAASQAMALIADALGFLETLPCEEPLADAGRWIENYIVRRFPELYPELDLRSDTP